MVAKNQLAWIWNKITSLSPYIQCRRCHQTLSLSLSATAVTHTYAMEANLCSASYVSRQSRDTARLCCCGAVAAGRRSWSNRSISPAYRAHSSKPAARCCSVDSWYRQTDRRTDTSPLHRPCCIHTMRAVSISIQSH